MMPIRPLVCLALLGPLALAATGCDTAPTEGYAVHDPYSSKYRTVAVATFQNRSFLTGLEGDIAEATVKAIQARTPMRVTGEARADTVLRGTITDVRLVEISKDPATGLANEMMLKVTVDFEWVDLATGKAIAARNGFVTSALFVPSRPAREPIELGRFAVVEQLALDLVDQMQSAW
jgi:hypothetical protein